MGIKDILTKIKPLEQEFIDIRHTIHQHPELGFTEVNTSQLIADKMIEWGYELKTGFASTGMVATLKVGNSDKTIGLRAEMDALPIQDNSGVAWQSVKEGTAHLCGHDGHTTMLLCAAKYLAQTKNFDGTLHLIWQPAEELLCGGSKMLEDGLFKEFKCDKIFAMHNMPGLNVGEFYFRKGKTMASSDTVQIIVTGVGGHGAFPHKAVDTVIAATQIVNELQTIVSRNIDPFSPAVVTVGSIQAGEAANVIPNEAKLMITVRTLDNEARKIALKRITEIATKVAESLGATAQVNHLNGSPVLINGDEETDFAYNVACALFGSEKCHDNSDPFMASEDFAFMLEAHPQGSYFFVGNGTAGVNGCPVHNPGYDFNDQNIIPGAALWAAITETYLSKV
ncbi:M20 aminoacylase family protein [Neisseria sp. Ec49-e6-T10]|uniref:M20 aminoacylase family protein n=1 Tax=Neisseria sp. Ec49-e6-T10 TaxID=3140744 RepID=UPI003EBAD927